MAILYNLYSDPECTQTAKNAKVGVLGLYGSAAVKSNWTEYNYHQEEVDIDVPIYKINGIYDGLATVSPVSWFNINIIYQGVQLFRGKYLITDDDSNSDPTQFPNAFFISRGGEVPPDPGFTGGSAARFLRIAGDVYNADTHGSNSVGIWLGRYIQNPAIGTGQREVWKYRHGTYDFYPEMDFNQYNDSLYTNIGLHKITLPWGEDGENINFIAVVCGYNDAGKFPAQLSDAGKGCIMLFPEEMWIDAEIIPDPYVGPVTKESVEGSFIGAADPYKDGISGRSDLDTDPFGLASLTPYLALMELTAVEYQWMVRSVFCGSNTIDLGSIEGLISDVFGEAEFIAEGQTPGVPMPKHRRNTDEVEIMTKGILSSKLIPSCFTITKGGKLVDASICGLSLNFSNPFGVRCLSSIGKASFTSSVIERRLNSFLDYEPYTTMQIFVPFCGKLAISPSMVYGNQLKFEFYCDLITGTLSCDIFIVEPGRTYIYTTMQGNCGIDMPMVGAAGNNIAAFTSMVGGLASMANSAIINPMAAALALPTAAQSILGGIREAQIDTPVIDRGSSNMNPYFSPRDCYLIINVPKPANPKNYLSLHGGVINGAGTVGSFAATNSEPSPGQQISGSRYAVFSDVDLSAVSATEEEKTEIMRQLQGGVHL